MKEMYESSLFIVENDGWMQMKDQLNDPEKYRNANFQSADSEITTLQKVFDIPDVPGDRKAKIASLRKIFEGSA